MNVWRKRDEAHSSYSTPPSATAFPLFFCGCCLSPPNPDICLPLLSSPYLFPSNWTDMPLFSVPWICSCNPRFLCAITHIRGGSPGGAAAELLSWAFDEQPHPHSTLLTWLCDGVSRSNSWVEEDAQPSSPFTHIATKHKRRSWQAVWKCLGEAALKTGQRLSCWWPDTDQRGLGEI